MIGHRRFYEGGGQKPGVDGHDDLGGGGGKSTISRYCCWVLIGPRGLASNAPLNGSLFCCDVVALFLLGSSDERENFEISKSNEVIFLILLYHPDNFSLLVEMSTCLGDNGISKVGTICSSGLWLWDPSSSKTGFPSSSHSFCRFSGRRSSLVCNSGSLIESSV